MSCSYTLSGNALAGVDPQLLHPNRAALALLPQTVCTGRLRPRARPYTVPLSDYLSIKKSQTVPDTIDWYTKAAAAIARMYRNNVKGCCVISSAYHEVGVWTGNETGIAVVGTDAEIDATYAIWNPGNQDRGCNITDVLDYTRDHGIKVNGILHRIDGYVSVDWTKIEEVLAAVYLFGTLKLGINLPAAWLNSDVWDVTNSQIVGGHDVPCVGALPGKIRIASWARMFDITGPAFTSTRWLEEAYAVLAGDWYSRAQTAPIGIDAVTLKKDMDLLGKGTIPPLDPNLQPWETILPLAP